MPKSDIPADVRRFLLTQIASVPHLEALMLMRTSAPARWSAAELAARLYVRSAIAAAVLEDLHGAQLLHSEADGTYGFVLPPGPLVEVIDTLAMMHGTHLVEITMLIHAKLDRKAQQFADAFDFRKDN